MSGLRSIPSIERKSWENLTEDERFLRLALEHEEEREANDVSDELILKAVRGEIGGLGRAILLSRLRGFSFPSSELPYWLDPDLSPLITTSRDGGLGARSVQPNRIDREKGLFHGRTDILRKDRQLHYLDKVGPPIQKMFGFDVVGHSLGASQILGYAEWERNKGKKKLLIHPKLSVVDGQPDWPTKRAIASGRTNELWILVEEGTPEEKIAWNLEINHAITPKRDGHYPSGKSLIESILFLSSLKTGLRKGTAPVNLAGLKKKTAVISLTIKQLRALRDDVLENIRKHCLELYKSGVDLETCRAAAVIAAAEIADVLKERFRTEI